MENKPLQIGEKIKARMKELDLSQKQVALELGWPTGTLSKVLSDKLPVTPGRLRELARALKTTPEILAAGTNSEKELMSAMQTRSLACGNLNCPGLHQPDAPKIIVCGRELVAFPSHDAGGREARICDYCGQDLIKGCVYCEAPFPAPGGAFCRYCGAPAFLICPACGSSTLHVFHKERFDGTEIWAYFECDSDCECSCGYCVEPYMGHSGCGELIHIHSGWGPFVPGAILRRSSYERKGTFGDVAVSEEILGEWREDDDHERIRSRSRPVHLYNALREWQKGQIAKEKMEEYIRFAYRRSKIPHAIRLSKIKCPKCSLLSLVVTWRLERINSYYEQLVCLLCGEKYENRWDQKDVLLHEVSSDKTEQYDVEIDADSDHLFKEVFD